MSKTKQPYQLPRVLSINESKLVNGVTIKIIKEYICKHEEMKRRYDYLKNLYEGFHDIFSKADKEEWKPDNRLVVNFPKYITDTFIGYVIGVPVKISHEDEKVNNALQAFNRQNELTDHEAEMAKKCCVFGHAFEYIYQNEDGKTKLTALSPTEVFVVYDDKLSQRALFAIRYGYYSDDSTNKKLYGEILTGDTIQEFEDETVFEGRKNPYGYIPIVEWRLNDERIGLYEPIAGLVETYNLALGEKANDVEAFAEAYLAIIGAEVDQEGVHRIRDDRIINFYGTDNARDVLVQFLQKPTADTTQENLLNRLEKQIYQISMVSNISDESFGSATSGVSLAYKLQAMSNLALTFDRKVEKSLRKRYKIFCSMATNVADKDAYDDIEIKFTRNIPANIQNEAEVAARLEGVVSRETQLSVLSIVSNPKEEIEKMEADNAAPSAVGEMILDMDGDSDE